LEIDAYNTSDGDFPKPSNTAYQKYIKYGWMWDWLYNAMEEL